MNGVRATVRPRERWKAPCKPSAPTSRKVSTKWSEMKIIQLGEIATPAGINIKDQQNHVTKFHAINRRQFRQKLWD